MGVKYEKGWREIANWSMTETVVHKYDAALDIFKNIPLKDREEKRGGG